MQSLTRRDLIKGGLVSGTALLLPGAAGRAAAGALPSLRPGGPARVGPYLALAGSLHDHSTDSDGDSSSEAISTWVTARREELGIDYAILSDHSDFFPLSPFRTAAMPAADPTSSWVRQVALDAQSTCDDLTYLRAFEWTNDQENHLNVLFSQNWTSRAVTGDAAPFWTWFDTAPITDPTGNGLGFGGGDGLGQFNHPGDKGALNWDDYAPDTVALQRMCTIEVHGDQGKGGRGTSDAGWYWFALAQGWLLGPVMNWDYHTWTGSGVLQASTPGSDYGVGGHLPGQRSVVFAGRNTTAGMREALAARRTCASEVPDGWAALTGPGGVRMGGTVAAAADGTVAVTVEAASPTEQLTRVEIVGDGGVSPFPYYYGDNYVDGAPQLPVGGVDVPPGQADSNLGPGYVQQHNRYLASGGHATRKARIDAPPPGTTLASAPMSGGRDLVEITVPLPTAPSPRPDACTSSTRWCTPGIRRTRPGPGPRPCSSTRPPHPPCPRSTGRCCSQRPASRSPALWLPPAVGPPRRLISSRPAETRDFHGRAEATRRSPASARRLQRRSQQHCNNRTPRQHPHAQPHPQDPRRWTPRSQAGTVDPGSGDGCPTAPAAEQDGAGQGEPGQREQGRQGHLGQGSPVPGVGDGDGDRLPVHGRRRRRGAAGREGERAGGLPGGGHRAGRATGPSGRPAPLTSASISAHITCRAAPTACASSPSVMFWLISAIATLTCSGTASPGAAAPCPGLSISDFWYLSTCGPLSPRVLLADHPSPTSRQVTGGGPPHQLPRDPGQSPSRTNMAQRDHGCEARASGDRSGR